MNDLIRLGAINKKTNKYIPPNQANKQDNYMCIDCGKDVFIRQGKIRVHHFAHCKEDLKCNLYSGPSESQIHKNAKLLLKYILENKIPLTIKTTCNKCNKIEEYDIPEISESSSIILEYRFDYNGVKIADIVYLEDSEILCIFEICNTHKTANENRPEPWFELDAEKLIEIFNNSDLQSINLECIRYNTCSECIIQQNIIENTCSECIIQQNIIENTLKKGTIYINQRGAGCGKTYESIQLIQQDQRFIDKDTFIYLTKTHTAKEVIYNEFKEQELRGKLNNLEIIENDNTQTQYKISYFNKKSNKKIQIIIGTIDSFNWAVVNKNKIVKHIDYFKGIVKTIINGFNSIKEDKIKYAGLYPYLTENCLVIIDEAQDLDKDLLYNFCLKIIRDNKINDNNLDNTIETTLNYIDTTNLVFGLYTTEELTGINAVTDVSFNDLSCNEFIPTIIDLSGQPFYYKYKIDPCGELFGNSVCGYNNYEKYRILNKSL